MKELIKGNVAIAQSAFDAGCDCYFGYPITPQTEIGEYLSKVMPTNGRAYVCAESEIASINMCIGAAATGALPMTSSASCAIGLMQEGLSYACSQELPLVLASVMRAGPGLGNIYPSQADYNQAVIGGGNGDYRIPVIAPSNVQECIHLTHRAFYLARKYRNPVIILAASSWILSGANGRKSRYIRGLSEKEADHVKKIEKLFEKYRFIEENEVLYEEMETADAEILLISFGSLRRNIKATVKEARKLGLKVGMLNPITLYPFPSRRISELSKKVKKIIVAEMNMGQMIRDVKSVSDNTIVEHIGAPAGNWLSTEEIIRSIKNSEKEIYATSL